MRGISTINRSPAVDNTLEGKMVRASQLIASEWRHVRGRIKKANEIFTLSAPCTLAQMLDSHQRAQLLRRHRRQ